MRCKCFQAIVLTLVCCLSVVIGCGSNEIPASVSLQAVSNFEQAKELIAAKDYEAGLQLLQKIETAGAVLDRPSLVKMYLLKAQCYQGLGNSEESLKNLELAAQGAEEHKDVIDANVALYKYWNAKGDTTKAAQALETAQSYDPDLVVQ